MDKKMEDLTKALAVLGFHQKPRRVEEAGISYEVLRVRHNLTLSLSTAPVYNPPESKTAEGKEGDQEKETLELDADGPSYLSYLSSLNPKEPKEQDHYKVLGLSKLRYQATTLQIRTAYRQKVLKFHPDKGSSVKVVCKLNEEELFTCIQKAFEQLGEEKPRRAYDSVDPLFDESVPEKGEVNAENFFDLLAPVFKRNARFSLRQPAPLLGDADSSRSDVEHFYDFWANWSSWREFSYLDAEDKSRGEDRFERREIEKANKAEREKLRKKDAKRVFDLVELAYQKDPRVARFKKEDRQAKEEMKELRKQERLQKERERRRLDEEASRMLSAIGEQMRARAEVDEITGVKSPEKMGDSINEEISCTNVRVWSPSELQLLVKAVNIYPAGTPERWKLIAHYVSLHGGMPRSEKDTIKQAKTMKSADSSSTQAVKIKESEAILADIRPSAKESVRPEKDVATWTAQQQKQLEAALHSIVPTDTQRWEKIADCVEGKTKKECQRRYKELVEMLKARNTRQKE